MIAIVRSDQIVHKSNRTKNKSDALDLIVGIIHVAVDLGTGGALEYSRDYTDQLEKYISEIIESEWLEWDLSELSKIPHLKLCIDATAYYLHCLCNEKVWTSETVDRAAIFMCLLIDTMDQALLEKKAKSLPQKTKSKDLHASDYLAKCKSAAMKLSFKLLTVNNQIVESLSEVIKHGAKGLNDGDKILLDVALCKVNEFRTRPDLKKQTSFIQRVARRFSYIWNLEKTRILLAAARAIVKYCDPVLYKDIRNAEIKTDANAEIKTDANAYAEERSRTIAPVISQGWILDLFKTVEACVKKALDKASYQEDTSQLIKWLIITGKKLTFDLCMQSNNASTESESQNNNSDISSQSGAAGETDSQSA